MLAVEMSLLGGFTVRVDGHVIPAGDWSRRNAAALVKVLALQPRRTMHREQVIDVLWPDETVDRATPKLHKATYFARRILDDAGAVVVHDEQVALYPDRPVSIDVDRFEDLARAALSSADPAGARQAIAAYGGELLPADRYEQWAEARREALRLRYLELLRLAERWGAVIDLDETDELAHLALMRRYAANGDRHGALRQFERLDRALRRELGVSPSRDATTLRDRLLGEHDLAPRPAEGLVGRDRELGVVDSLLSDTAGGRGGVVLVGGPAGIGKSALLAVGARRAAEMGLRLARGSAAPVEGAWPYAPVIEALADLARRHPALLDGLADGHRHEIDRALAGEEVPWSGESSHQRLFVATAELVRLASATHGLLLEIDDLHDADDASVRLVHFLARSMRGERCAFVLAYRSTASNPTLSETRRSLIDRHGATELELGPLDRAVSSQLVRRVLPDVTDDVDETIWTLSRGVPFAVNELARRAAHEPRWVLRIDATAIGAVQPATRDTLQRVAIVGATFDTDEFVALSGLSEGDAYELLDDALANLAIEATGAGYRFRHGLVRDALLDDMPPHRRRQIHRDAADRLIELRASPARIGHHLLAAGAGVRAVPYLLRAAETDAAVGAYRDALALVDAVRPHATGADRAAALLLRADLLNASGDPLAIVAYREALDEASGAAARHLRVRLASSAMMAGDIATADAALEGIELDGGADDADILLARGKSAYFRADFATAQAAAEDAQRRVLGGERNWKVLDLITLQGLLAHRSGGWFDRMQIELRRSRGDPEMANAIFDGYLCAAEYMLYGPTPYAEVIRDALDLKATAMRAGALRATAFAAALAGEAALLSGNLELAGRELTEASEVHHDIASPAGEALSLQRLAEVRLAEGDVLEAARLAGQALPLGRASIIARHVLQRVFGTLIRAACDAAEARAIVDRAESTIGWEDHCLFCGITFWVPATIACAHVGDLAGAARHLEAARRSVVMWVGTSWEAAVEEAAAAVDAAAGRHAAAVARLDDAAERFRRAGQPLDAERCVATAALLDAP